jgi:hypothetical protein
MNILDVIVQSGIIYDRHLGTSLALPYSGFDTIAVAQNELVTADAVNSAFKKLYDNYSYLYKSTRIASNLIPISAVGFLGILPPYTTITWQTVTPFLSTSEFTSLPGTLNDIKVITGGINTALNQYVFFASTGQDIIVLRGDTQLNSIAITLSTTHTGVGSNINFQGINSLYLDTTNNNLYVCDLSANTIYKYNANGFLTDTTILQNVLIYDRSIGGYGGFDDRIFFSKPNGLYAFNSYLYVLDSGNSCIKQYDLNLNWINTHRLFRDFANTSPLSIMFETLSGSALVLTDTNSIYRYDNSFNTKTVINLPVLSASGEYYSNIIPSTTDSNIFYITTNKNVYKRFVTDPSFAVGPYLTYLYGVNTSENIKSFISFANNSNDNNLIFSTYEGRGLFSLYCDNLNLESILANINFDVYSPKDVLIDRDEYVQNWIFNKAIAKFHTNHERLRDQIIGKFLYLEDTGGNIVFDGIRYTLPDELATVAFNQNITDFIGCNEIFQNAVLNRALKGIFNIQVSLFNLLQADIKLTVNQNQPVYL